MLATPTRDEDLKKRRIFTYIEKLKQVLLVYEQYFYGFLHVIIDFFIFQNKNA